MIVIIFNHITKLMWVIQIAGQPEELRSRQHDQDYVDQFVSRTKVRLDLDTDRH